jgi:hypothetical protein
VSRAFLKAARGRLADDAGVAGLLVAGLVAIIAFTSLTVYLRGYLADREFARFVGGSSRQGPLVPATLASFLQASTHVLPCPDSKATPNGTADTAHNNGTPTNLSDDTCTARSGVVPWATLGISREDAIDPYGNYYRYTVSNVAHNICSTVTSDITGATATTTYTGGLIDPTDLAFVQLSGDTRNVPFVIISHGKNGLGAKSGTGTSRDSATSSLEVANASASPATVYAGPYSTVAASYFDDQVMAPTTAQLRRSCEDLTPGGKLNSDISENFSNPTIDSTKFATSNVASIVQPTNPGNRVGAFTATVAYLATAVSYNFTPTVRPLYVSTLWTPNADGAENHAGLSIVTRATLADLNDDLPLSDIFDENTQLGLTFRFYQSGGANIDSTADGVDNTISILSHAGAATTTVTSPGNYNLINGETYLLEVYDNGSEVWMRITQSDDPTNTLTLSATNTTDLTGEQRVMFINDFEQTGGNSVSYLDDIVIGTPMLALETGPASGVVATPTATNGTTTGNLTLEAWVRLKAFPAGSNRAAIISQWDTNAAATDAEQSFRLYFDGANADQLAFDVGTIVGGSADTEHFDLQFKPNLNEWNHVAVTFNASSKSVRFYLNGELSLVNASGSSAANGVNTAQERFSVGAAFDGGTTVTDVLTGNISDVRAWNTVRTSAEIRTYFQSRLSLRGAEGASLIVNWVFDRESGIVGSAQDVETSKGAEFDDVTADDAGDGVFAGSATYVATLATYYRPLSTSFCPSGTRAGPYQCDFRTSSASGLSQTSVTIPANLRAFYAKVWGAGGGGYEPSGSSTTNTAGGTGGFSGGLVEQVGPSGSLVAVSAQVLQFFAGGYGTGSTAVNQAGGGGAGSGIFTTAGDAIVVAGGGGGATYSNFDVTGSGNCSLTAVIGSTSRCGLGGLGGGYLATTNRANDQGTSDSTRCGGRGGDNDPTATASPPTTSGDCDSGGASPTDPEVGSPATLRAGGGASTGTGGAGGSPTFIAGGRGYLAGAATRTGGGGAGGGHQGGEAGGYQDSGSLLAGFGGGGGSGTVGAGVLNGVGSLGSVSYNAAGSYTTSATGSWTTGPAPVTVTMSSVTVAAGGWLSGCSVSVSGGLHIGSGGNTIASLTGTYTFTLSTATNGADGNFESGTITFNCSSVITAGFSTTAGNASDPYYSPSYLNTTANEDALEHPGRGGTTEVTNSTSRNGKGGAIVILW